MKIREFWAIAAAIGFIAHLIINTPSEDKQNENNTTIEQADERKNIA